MVYSVSGGPVLDTSLRTIESDTLYVVLVDFGISEDIIARFRNTVPDCASIQDQHLDHAMIKPQPSLSVVDCSKMSLSRSSRYVVVA